MDVVGFTVGPVQENAWLVSNDGRAVLVDPGEEAERLQREIEERAVKVEAILITHCHFDHVGAVAAMVRSTGAPVYCPAGEVKILENINDYVRWPGFGPFEPYSPEHAVNGGDTLELAGLIAVYVAVQLPLTVYILESFFARIPSDLFDAARIDGYSEWEILWKVSLPIALPAISTTVILNTILLWNEFLYAVVLITDDAKRTLPLGIQRFLGDQLEDVGMIATGLIIAIVPVVLIYAFFSEKLIQGMTAGAVK